MDPIRQPPGVDDLVWARFAIKVKRSTETDCWNWIAARTKSGLGYGLFSVRGKLHVAHRLSYEWFIDEIPEGLQLDHLCRNMGCVNPDHLESVTLHENNVVRGQGKAAVNAKKTHCPKDHPFDDMNTYVDKTGRRHCRECSRKHAREWKLRVEYRS